MVKNSVVPKSFLLLLLTSLVLSQAQPQPWSPLQAPKELAKKLNHGPNSLLLASTDFGHTVHKIPLAVLNPTSINDISELIKFSKSLPNPFTIAARGNGHSLHGQAMAYNGIVINMREQNSHRNGSGIVVSWKAPSGYYADVGGEQTWIDVLHATLERGLTPLSWTDYLYLTIGGTLSNAGISGQSFRFGPQISNVHELDVVTGNGDIITCSAKNNSQLFFAVLGGLGQFGIITRARIPLVPAPTRASANLFDFREKIYFVKWLQMLYSDFLTFSKDQENLISFNKSKQKSVPDYIEGSLLLNHPPLDLSFYPVSDQPKITSLVTRFGIIYVLELVKYYDDESRKSVDKEIQEIIRGLNFLPTFIYEKDASYEQFLNRVYTEELALSSQELWDRPHPWLNLFVPKSRISDFNEGVFKGILLKQNLTAGTSLVYPTNRSKWDGRMSAITPDEDVFYVVSLLYTSEFDQLKAYQTQNQQILQFCKDAGIQIKQYLSRKETLEQWVEHFGPKWGVFKERKAAFDPKHILSPGQKIFIKQ
ncbi:hypothetical protein L6164_037559 [Bauhinia variegata]|uniref:Uncharacterized protein n=1 Tax=Bauhinia variegata TaxID=167791 RepID=A0ACB9KKD2_BAUVA|nr:hypothetical protein L6164_037559 [Bauhinia variegata]